MKLSGADILIECLKEQGVTDVFGYPGGAAIELYDALYRHSDEINHYLTSHEQGASHAADGYARATGKVGVCMATSGPGATNLVTGIATAYMDSIPMVAITCNVGVSMLGKDSFQEIDIAGVTMPITKHNYIVKDITKLADTIRCAFKIARTGRPGPVLVDITKDVTANSCEYEKKEVAKEEKVNSFTKEEIAECVELIKEAKKPFIFLGGGVILSNASKEANELAHIIDAPVTSSLMGHGAFDERDPLYAGMIGMHGSKAANFGVSECDLLITIGARFSDRDTGNTKTFAPMAKVIHIDIDPAEINKNIKTVSSLVGDAKEVLAALNKELPELKHAEWTAQVEANKAKYPARIDHSKLNGPEIIDKIYEMTGDNAVIVTDVGQHQMWTAQYFKYSKPRTLLTSGGLGTMGYGLGAAIGAKVGCPDANVINITGDGCFRMNLNELATATRYNIGLIEIIFNNQVLGMVRQWQGLYYQQRYSQTTLEDKTDFVKISEGFGARAYKVTTIEEFEKAFKEALASKEAVVIECMIGKDDKVFPMVSPGTSLSQTFDEKDLKEK